MGVEVRYLEKGPGIEFYASGTVWGRDILNACEQAVEASKTRAYRYQLIDRTECEEYFANADEIRQIAEYSRQLANRNPGFIIAIVSPNELVEMSAKLWRDYLDGAVPHLRLFSSRAEAEAWIETQLGR